MTFPFNIYVLTFAGAVLMTMLTVPLWRRWSSRTGLVDDPGHRKIHDNPIPLAGGLAVMTGILIPLLLGSAALACYLTLDRAPRLPGFSLLGAQTTDLLAYGLTRRASQLMVILGGALAMVLLGYLDDKHELSARAKFGGQFLIAMLVALSGVRITLFIDNILFSYAITILWILTVTNAFNFMDNMNGLCAGLGAIGAWQFAVSASVHGQYLVVLLSLLTFGALLGFLPFNFPRASIFLGDAGSHLVGFLLSVLAILPHFYTPETQRAWTVITPLLILAVPLGDMAWVVLWRFRHHRPVYIGDTNHLSHRLTRRGLSRSHAVLIIWLLAAAAGSLPLLLGLPDSL